jgi:hypothetical protein
MGGGTLIRSGAGAPEVGELYASAIRLWKRVTLLLRRTLNSAYYSIDGSCSLREKNRMRAVLAGIPLALVLSWMERGIQYALFDGWISKS